MERMIYHYCSACHTLLPSFAVPIDCYWECDAPPPPVSFAELVDNGTIVPGSAAASRLIIRQRDGSMPPQRGGRPPMSEAELSALESFINSLDPEQELSCEDGE